MILRGRVPIGLAVLFFISGCAIFRPSVDIDKMTIPPVEREFRAVWIATVANIDWPSRPGLPVERQQDELRALLDRVRALNMNAVILQVRPAADALYLSEYEPWSEYLTGTQGAAPEPFYDPLAFAVEEAHRRGLELHAWFNPFRAKHPSARSELDSTHAYYRNPEIVKHYGSHHWFDPGMEEAQDHSVRVMLDVVRRYDIDGVHLDDYFYPYKERDSLGAVIDFPDSISYARYLEGAAGEPLTKDDWRRNNVDRFIERLYREIKNEKPHVKFGVSPFGIWRPGYPAQIRGFDAFAEIYADAKLWLNNGWIDYFSPQLYWPIDQYEQSYPVLLRWWHEENTHRRHLWPGNFTSRVADQGQTIWPSEEIIRQIHTTRAQDGAEGNIHFSIRALVRNSDNLIQRIDADAYREPALVPASPWLDNTIPSRPIVRSDVLGSDVLLTLGTENNDDVWLWTIRSKHRREWRTEIIPGWKNGFRVRGDDAKRPPSVIAVTAVSRTGNESVTVLFGPDEGSTVRFIERN
jgi:uncharacterized lipoprotein YddW (UPF0748 family)